MHPHNRGPNRWQPFAGAAKSFGAELSGILLHGGPSRSPIQVYLIDAELKRHSLPRKNSIGICTRRLARWVTGL